MCALVFLSMLLIMILPAYALGDEASSESSLLASDVALVSETDVLAEKTSPEVSTVLASEPSAISQEDASISATQSSSDIEKIFENSTDDSDPPGDVLASKTDDASSQNASESSAITTDSAPAEETAPVSTSQDPCDDVLTVQAGSSRGAYITYAAEQGGGLVPGNTAGSGEAVDGITEFFSNPEWGSALGATAVVNAGYKFTGWYNESTNELVSQNITYIPVRPEGGWPAVLQFVARFSPEAFLLKFDANGGSGAAQTQYVSFGEDAELPVNGTPQCNVSRSGYTFDGWSTSPDTASTSSVSFADGDVLKSNVSDWFASNGFFSTDASTTMVLTLYARWIENYIVINYSASKGGTISFDSNSTSFASESLGAATGSREDGGVGPSGATAQASRGYHFVWWTSSGSGSKVSSNNLSGSDVSGIARYAEANSSDSIYHSASFEAAFAPNTYSVSYDANDGSGVLSTASVSYDGSIALANGTVREGYDFAGWNTSSDGSGQTIAAGASIDADTLDTLISSGYLSDSDGSALSLYAMWDAVQSEEVTPVEEPANTQQQTVIIPDVVTNEVTNEVVVETPLQVVETITQAITQVVAQPVEQVFALNNEALASLEPVSTAQYASASEESVGGIFGEMTAGEATRVTSTAVGAVITVGALAGLVGVTASIAGASAVATTAAVGAVATTGISGAVEVAADLAAGASAAGSGAAAAGSVPPVVRRRKDHGKNDEYAEEQEK